MCWVLNVGEAESAGSLEKEVYHLQRELLQERTKATFGKWGSFTKKWWMNLGMNIGYIIDLYIIH